MKKTLLLLVALITTTIAFAKTEIDGIYYNLNNKTKTAEVTPGSSKYFGDITIPEKVTYNATEYSVTSIGDNAFYYCSLLTSITIPNSVTYIGWGAFQSCSSLTSISIGNSVTSIGDWAFYDCDALTSITIPNSVTSIGIQAFCGCRSLTSITIPNSVTSIGDWAFSSCSSLTSITIPNSVTSIGDNAFYECSSLTSITIGNSVTSIGYRAFYECSSLTSISIGNSVTSIGDWAFYDCDALTSITIPNSVTSIGNDAFCDCLFLTSITIGNSVTSIGLGAFLGCSSLTSITIPNSVTSIGIQAFCGCRSLTSITIPNSVTSIGDLALSYCSSLTSIDVEANNQNYASIDGVLYNKEITTLICCPGGKTSITIPNSVTSIGLGAFLGCSSLTSITIPNSVTSIGWGAFQSCSSLTSITIGNSVTSIGDDAFSYCNNLTSITCLGSTPPEASDLGADTENCTLKVPNEAYNDYLQHAYWGQFSNIETLDTNLYKKLEILVNDTLFGYVNVSNGYYCVNDSITIHAIPNEGYEFTQWSDGNTKNPRTICITSDTTITAEFRVATTPTTVENTLDNQIKIYTTNGTLHIEGATDDYHILDAAGRLIYSGNATTLQLPRGIYLITMGGEVEKIVL